MILFTFENDQNTAIKTEAFTSAREQFTCSDVIPTCPDPTVLSVNICGEGTLYVNNNCIHCVAFKIVNFYSGILQV